MSHLCRLEQRVDGHVHQSGAHGSQRHQAGEFGLWEPSGDPVSGFKALIGQKKCQSSDTII
jgi:hypothetical protein